MIKSILKYLKTGNGATAILAEFCSDEDKIPDLIIETGEFIEKLPKKSSIDKDLSYFSTDYYVRLINDAVYVVTRILDTVIIEKIVGIPDDIYTNDDGECIFEKSANALGKIDVCCIIADEEAEFYETPFMELCNNLVTL